MGHEKNKFLFPIIAVLAVALGSLTGYAMASTYGIWGLFITIPASYSMGSGISYIVLENFGGD